MPLEGDHAGDIGLETVEGLVCKFDTDSGAIKSPQEIFNGGTAFFLSAVAGGDQGLAERLTRKNMKALPYWQQRPFDALNGPEATDAEFGEAMGKLS
jgi:hypothetical protein